MCGNRRTKRRSRSPRLFGTCSYTRRSLLQPPIGQISVMSVPMKCPQFQCERHSSIASATWRLSVAMAKLI